MNRILEVTDEDESLILQFVDLEDLRNEGSSRDSRPNGRRRRVRTLRRQPPSHDSSR